RSMNTERRDADGHKQTDEKVITPITALQQWNANADRYCNRKRGVDKRTGPAPRRQNQDTPSKPKRCDRHQPTAARRRPIGPVAHGGEEKTGYHREGEAIEHLVRMPERCREITAWRPSQILRGPETDRYRREAACQQIEGAEAQAPECQTVSGAETTGGIVH